MAKDFTRGGAFSNINIASFEKNAEIGATVWSTEKVNKLLEDYAAGNVDIRGYKGSPFFMNDTNLRKPKLQFQYTKHEMRELRRCARDPIYFAKNYCQLFTEEGYIKVNLRDYQREVINGFLDNRFVILMAARQVGKTVTAAVFMLWYLLFHKEKNVLVVADIGETTKEIVDKIKNIMNNLPFFMKPGISINNVMSMKFDNDCRLIGRNTTRKTGIGLSINLLYMDEFAHIDESYLKFFYSNIYPTIESMPNSKIIITSTPNGLNTFHDLWIDALDKKNSYYPMRIDWWQAPGRDEEWKKRTIANLASEEDFNQNYGLQFFSADKLLLDSYDLKKIYQIEKEYVTSHFDALEIEGIDYSKYFKMHPKFAAKFEESGHCDFRHMKDYFIFSIDTAEGVGKDYTVCNVYKLAPLPKEFLLRHRTAIHSEYETIGLIQVAVFRSNNINTDKFADVAQAMLFRLFNPEYVRVIVELNHKGFVVKERLEAHGDYWPGLLIHSKHTINAKFWSPGIILNSGQKKIEYCEGFKYLLSLDRIIPNEHNTVMEIGAFGKVGNGTYRSQSGNDDLAVSSVNLAAFFESPQYYELCGEVYNSIQDNDYLNFIEAEVFEYNRLRENADRKINMLFLNELNQTTN
jgi:hypothetical protein